MKRSSVAPVQPHFVQYVKRCSVRTFQGSLGGPLVPTTNPPPPPGRSRAGAADLVLPAPHSPLPLLQNKEMIHSACHRSDHKTIAIFCRPDPCITFLFLSILPWIWTQKTATSPTVLLLLALILSLGDANNHLLWRSPRPQAALPSTTYPAAPVRLRPGGGGQ
jgi:hypothetical protein